MMEREFKSTAVIQLRKLETDTDDSRIVAGYAVKFDEPSQFMGFTEYIRKSAITEELIMNSDIFARLNHDEGTVLARSRNGVGSLALELREDGLYYEFESPHTQVGDELLEHLRRGEICSSSFAFSLPSDGSGERWYKDDEGNLCREILKIERLYDISPVYEPAYLSTSCSKRSIDKVTEINNLMEKYDSMLSELEKNVE